MPRELVDQRLEELAALARDLGGELAVAEPRAGEAEIAVKRIDQDLEGGLAGLAPARSSSVGAVRASCLYFSR